MSPQVSLVKEYSADLRLRFNRFAWIVARTLRVLGRVWARLIQAIAPGSYSAQPMVDRFLHLNEVLGYLLPSLTYVVSEKVMKGSRIAFRPFTDDADKVFESYEPMVRTLLSPVASAVVVDIGANIGTHTIWLSRKVGPSGLVVAVEPEHNNFLILSYNQTINGIRNILGIRTALGSSPTKGKLTVPRPTLMGQASTQMPSPSARSYAVSVTFDTLDNIISTRQITSVYAIKIDVEGAEISVLQGAQRTIERFGPRLVIESHGARNLYATRALLESMNMDIESETIASSRPNEDRRFILAVPHRYLVSRN
jgi:FkbM family methyltransferase